MQSLGRRYVRYVNVLYRRTGTLWEGRYRAVPIDSEAYFLACCPKGSNRSAVASCRYPDSAHQVNQRIART
jgi:hypothetical protein